LRQYARRVPDLATTRHDLLAERQRFMVRRRHGYFNLEVMIDDGIYTYDRFLCGGDFAAFPLIVIRFNPDSYVSNGVKYTCWRHDGNGILVVSRSKAKEWRERLTTLNHEIQKWMQTKSEKTLQVVHLFYGDGVK